MSFETRGIVTGQSVQSRRAAENVTFSVNRPPGVAEEPEVKHLALTAHALFELRCAFDAGQAHLEIKTSHSLNTSPFFNGNIFSKVYYVGAEWRHFTFQTLTRPSSPGWQAVDSCITFSKCQCSAKCELKEENCGERLAYTQSVLCKEPEYECENATPDLMQHCKTSRPRLNCRLLWDSELKPPIK